MAKTETVAIIGGGIAGLSCANHLLSSRTEDGLLPLEPTVFDTGRLRPGGRCSSRFRGDDSENDDYPLLSEYTIDHAAQIISIPASSSRDKFKEFEQQVRQWEEQGILAKFPSGTVCEVARNHRKNARRSFYVRSLNRQMQDSDSGNGKRPAPPDMYYAVNGMGSLPLNMMKPVNVKQDVWVSPSNGVRFQRGKWRIQANGKQLGEFDRLVIAHNGKCADRLMSKTPAKQVHKLLRVNFAPTVRQQSTRMTLNSIYSLTFALDKKTSALSKILYEDRFISGFIKNHPNLRFLTCQTRKHKANSNDDVEVWTVLSSSSFAKRYKAPQEFLPPEVVKEVTTLLLQSLEECFDMQSGSLVLTPSSSDNDEEDETPISTPIASVAGPPILESRLQLWGAAVPLNTWVAHGSDSKEEALGFLYDGQYGVGVCGDWLLDASIAGAWESGRRLATFMTTSDTSKQQLSDDGDSLLVGVGDGKFETSQQVARAGIGSL